MSSKKKKTKATYQEIATKANVSVMSVSNVLRRPETVKPETREKVFSAIESIGGTTSLHQYKKIVKPRPHRRIKLLIMGIPYALIKEPIYSRLFQSIITEAEAHDFEVTVRNLPLSKELAKGVTKDADALLLMGTWDQVKIDTDIPTITLLSTQTSLTQSDNIDYNRQSVGKIAANYFISKNIRTVAYIGPEIEYRYSTFFETMDREGNTSTQKIIIRNAYIAESDRQIINVHSIHEAVKNALQKKPSIKGIFSHSDQISAIVNSCLKEQGLSPGKDIALIGCNNDEELLDLIQPKPASIDLEVAEIGKKAVLRAIEMISSHTTLPPIQTILQPRLVDPESNTVTQSTPKSAS